MMCLVKWRGEISTLTAPTFATHFWKLGYQLHVCETYSEGFFGLKFSVCAPITLRLGGLTSTFPRDVRTGRNDNLDKTFWRLAP